MPIQRDKKYLNKLVCFLHKNYSNKISKERRFMKRKLIVMTAVLFSSLGHSDEIEKKAEQGEPKDVKDQISYAIGVNIGRNLNQSKIEVNFDNFLLGVKDGQVNKLSLMTDEEIAKVMADLQKEMVEKHQVEMKAKGAKNLAEQEKFLLANKKKKGVVTLPSGLQYRVIKKGEGDSPKLTDKVNVHYRGKLLDGTEFDSSYARNKTANFSLGHVIPAWTEALQLMKPGAKYELFVPSKLAYKEHGLPNGTIGPNAALVFEIELFDVEKPQAPAPVQAPAVEEPELKE